jgi:hypothetical protein
MDFLEYMKNIEQTFVENLTHFLTWKIEFSEEIDYDLKGTATRLWKCNILVIVYESDIMFADTFCDMAKHLTYGWCKLEV